MPRDPCDPLTQTVADLALAIGSRPGFDTLDAIHAELAKSLPELSRAEMTNAIVEATKGRAAVMSDVQEQLAAIKREARSDKALRAKVAELQTHLTEGTTPGRTPRPDTATEAVRVLREVRDQIARQVKGSEPAVRERLLKSIDDLTDRLETVGNAPVATKGELASTPELDKLIYRRDVLRRNLRRRINDMKPKSVWEVLRAPSDFFKTIKSSYDMSALLRQAGPIALGHPGVAAKATESGFKSLSKQQYHKMMQRVTDPDRPHAALKDRSGLYIADADSPVSKREESIASRTAGAIPGIGASQRNYSAILNEVRDSTWDILAGMTKGDSPTLDEAKIISNYINVATGRGELGPLEGARNLLNSVFFSPGYHVSRFQYAIGQPVWTGLPQAAFQRRLGSELKATGRIRVAVARQYARTLTGLAIVYTLANLAGDDVQTDPRSSDFGKPRTGNTRQDVLMGIGQQIVLLARLASGQTMTGSGKVVPIRGNDVPYKGATASSLLWQFFRQKLSPLPGAAIDMLDRKNAVGEKVTPGGAALGLVTPMTLQNIDDIRGAVKDYGPIGGALKEVLNFFGMGLQHYGDDKEPLKIVP